ncbi:MAG: class D beta-lactamase [Paracoccaceae bacterium]
MNNSIGHSRVLIAIAVVLAALGHQAAAQDRMVRSDLQAVFDQHNVTGTFVLIDPETDRYAVVNETRADRRMYPASTFKIANSLIALETGVVEDVEEIIPYGGRPQPIARWEQDMSMRDAIKVSNVPVYQEIARRIGLDGYAHWLNVLDYGNQQAGKDVETFWLKGPLKITPFEQVDFLALLATQTLALQMEHQLAVRDILRLGRRDQSVLFAKTGWTTAPDPDIGWFVGWVERKGAIYPFALNMDMKSDADAEKREMIAIEILEALGVY